MDATDGGSATTEQPSVASARLRPPRLFAPPVGRSRLRARLDGHWKVAIVTARAAAGKTTFVANWAGDRPEPVAWLTCDRTERDGDRLVAALQSAARVALGHPASLTLPPEGPSVGSLVAELDAAGTPIVLVVDDYHMLDPLTAGPIIDVLVDETDGRVRLLLAGRGRPPLRLARLRVQRRAVVLDDDDLVFDDDEAAAMLRTTMGLDLSDADARAVQRRCEGWAGGMCLVGLASMRRGGNVSSILAEMERAGSHVGQLLVDEVLDSMPDDDIDFLLRVSLLDRLEPQLCEAVTGRRDARARLAAVHRDVGFVVAVDDERAPYRLHSLFRSVLRDRADAVLRDEVADVHRRAAAWFEQHGDDGEAIDHLLAAGNYRQAAMVIRQARDDGRFVGDFRRQLRWLDALPDEIVAADRDLTAGRLMCRYIVGGELRASTDDPTSASEAILAYLGAALRGDLAAEQRFATLAEKHARRRDPTALTSARAVRATVALMLDDLRAARELLEPVVEDRGAFSFERVLANALLAVAADAQGDRETVARASRTALAEDPPEHQRYHDVQQLLVAFLAEQRGDLASAAVSLRRFADGDPTVALPRFRVYALLRLARLEAALGHTDEAEVARREALATWQSLQVPGPWLERLAAEAGLDLPRHTGPAPAMPAETDLLSDRERQVLRLLRGSLSLREIADELYVSHNTIKTHARSIYRKLGVTQRAELRSSALQ